VVSVVNIPGAGLQAEISNPSSAVLAAVINTGTDVVEHDLNPGTANSLPFTFRNGAAQLHIQPFPDSGLSEVVTIVLSAETSTTALPPIVGQAFTGGV
jgi:hypothetical protein